jgi:hypothetical protein
MKKLPKLEARIAFFTIFSIKNVNLLLSIIYRAGYIEDLFILPIKDLNEITIANHILKSSHYGQLRYYVFKPNKKIKLNFEKLYKTIKKPIIVSNKDLAFKLGLTNEEFYVLKRRSYILDGLNILNIITNSIKRSHASILPKLSKHIEA